MTAALLRPAPVADDFSGLSPLSERLAHAFQDMLAKRAKIEVKAGPAALARYTEWRIAQNPFGMLLRYTLGAQDDEMILHIPGYLISQIIDIEYGGSGQLPSRNAFTPAETRFVERLATQILPQLAMAAGIADTGGSRLAEMQPDILAFGWPKSRDQIVVAGIFIEGPSIKAATISMFVDVATARQTGDRLCATQEATPTPNPVWQDKMQAAALRIRLPARAILTRTELPASRLLTLAPGDILPVMLPTKVPLTIAGRHFASGTIGEANGRAALKIEHIGGMDHE